MDRETTAREYWYLAVSFGTIVWAGLALLMGDPYLGTGAGLGIAVALGLCPNTGNRGRG